jgi:peptidoglycan/xylan/chitin deacetylase (PgdA/CDA1 family)
MSPVTDPPKSWPRKRWNPPAFLTASAGVHVAAIAAVATRPDSWPWALGAVVANHLVLTGAGLWPRSKLLGPNWTSLPREVAARGEVAVTIDDGPDPEVTPRVLDLLDAHRAQATFFCIGELVERHSGLAKEIVRRGHSIENHSHRHLNRFSVLGPRGMTEEIVRAQDTIAAVTGEVPRFFRAPAGLRNPFLDRVLNRLDLRLASWTRRGFDTLDRQAHVVLDTLTRGARGGDILLLHDGHAGHTPAGGVLILEVLPRLLANLATTGLKPVTLRSTLATAEA